MVSSTDLPVLLLKSDYADLRDLAKVLLGFNGAILVFSLTFADRTAAAAPGRPAKLALLGAWSSFLVAIAVAGVAVSGPAVAAERGLDGRTLDARTLGGAIAGAYGLLAGAGVLSGLGLCGLFVAGVLALRLRETPQRGAQSS